MSRLYRHGVWSVLLLLCACGGGGGGGSTSSGASGSSSSSGAGTTSNVATITVGNGPAAATNQSFNIPYTSVKICLPNTTTCATINNVLVDTGSVGLRIMASTLVAAGLSLPNLADPSNSANTLAECLPFADGYTWGPLAKADVSMAGETASDLTINVINDNNTYAPPAPSSCTSSNTTNLNSVSDFDANGVLGVGLFDQDCGTFCSQCNVASGGCALSEGSDIYYTCPSGSSATCQFQDVALTTQVRNPVALFATDNNGVIIELPSIPAAGQPTASGSLIFGIGTQSNNALGSATVLQANLQGNITTVFNGSTLSSSFLDTGSNGLYFADSAIQTCSQNTDFYCPSSTLSLSATNQGSTGTTSQVSFQIANIANISGANYAINDVGGGVGSITSISNFFDWGLPFFYGRNVYNAIDGKVAGTATGPYVAY